MWLVSTQFNSFLLWFQMQVVSKYCSSCIGGKYCCVWGMHVLTSTPLAYLAQAKAVSSQTMTRTAWFHFKLLPSPTHDICLDCSSMSGLMKLDCLHVLIIVVGNITTTLIAMQRSFSNYETSWTKVSCPASVPLICLIQTV